jgi:multidrug efflux pump subunit AcrA (membrane-fusion protein)
LQQPFGTAARRVEQHQVPLGACPRTAAHVAGKITELNVSEGAAINSGDPIAKIE